MKGTTFIRPNQPVLHWNIKTINTAYSGANTGHRNSGPVMYKQRPAIIKKQGA